MSEEELLRIINNISKPRIKTYEGLGFPEKDVDLISAYFAIQEISSHFFVPLQVLEICLRNSINNALTPLLKGNGLETNGTTLFNFPTNLKKHFYLLKK